MAPIVSVIVPVYNVEKYLRETLDSVINQSLKDIEIICVDNNSKDKTLSILKEYASTDKRFVIIEQNENLKQGIARNIGVKIAKGEYVFFIDGDDIMQPYCLEKMYNRAKKEESDITICCWSLLDDISKNINDKHEYALL